MNHKKYQTILWFAFLTLISVLLLAWPSLLTHAGPDLPSRETPTPVQPPDDKDDDKPVGAHIVLQVRSAPVGVWTVVQWQDSAGDWHDIEGWQGTLDEGKKVWWVDAAAFGKGPFRWVIYQDQRDKPLAQSESFYLPYSAGEAVMIEVSLVPSQSTSIPNSPSTLPSLSPDGGHIELCVRPAQAGLWTIVQWQDDLGDWHDIEGWQGTLDGGKKVWWVAPADSGKGPFRWVVYQGQRGKLLARSESFYLPYVGQTVRIDVSLAP